MHAAGVAAVDDDREAVALVGAIHGDHARLFGLDHGRLLAVFPLAPAEGPAGVAGQGKAVEVVLLELRQREAPVLITEVLAGDPGRDIHGSPYLGIRGVLIVAGALPIEVTAGVFPDRLEPLPQRPHARRPRRGDADEQRLLAPAHAAPQGVDHIHVRVGVGLVADGDARMDRLAGGGLVRDHIELGVDLRDVDDVLIDLRQLLEEWVLADHGAGEAENDARLVLVEGQGHDLLPDDGLHEQEVEPQAGGDRGLGVLARQADEGFRVLAPPVPVEGSEDGLDDVLAGVVGEDEGLPRPTVIDEAQLRAKEGIDEEGSELGARDAVVDRLEDRLAEVASSHLGAAICATMASAIPECRSFMRLWPASRRRPARSRPTKVSAYWSAMRR